MSFRRLALFLFIGFLTLLSPELVCSGDDSNPSATESISLGVIIRLDQHTKGEYSSNGTRR